MKIRIVRDAKGKTIATYQPVPGATVSLEAKVKKGEKMEEIEAPKNHASNLEAFYKRDKKPQK